MRKLFLVALVVAGFSANVQASSISPLVNQTNNYIDFNNSEVFINNYGAAGALDVGDEYFGVLRIQEINSDNTYANVLQGIFNIAVKAIDVVAPNTYQIVFGKGTQLAAKDASLPLDTILALYKGGTLANYNVVTPGNVTNITSLTQFGAFGFDPEDDTAATIGDGYWKSEAFFDADGVLPAIPPSSGLSTAFGLNKLTWGSALLDNPGVVIIQQNNGSTTIDDAAATVYDLVGASLNRPILSGDPHSALGWTIRSTDPAQIHVVPEPGSLIVWSMIAGGFGVVALRRRKEKNAA